MDMYALMIGLGASLGIWRVYQTAPMEQRNEYVNNGLLVQFFILIGSRLGYVFLRWAFYSEVPSRIFQFYDGGLSLWGAVVGGLLGIIVVLVISERQFFQVTDALIPMLTPLTIFGWLASWQVGLAYGEVAPGDLWWSFPMLDESGIVQPRFPLQLMAAFSTLLPLAWLEIRQPFAGVIGMQTSASLIFFSAITVLFTLQRADPGVFWGKFRPELWTSLLLLVLGFCGFIIITVHEYRKG
ncbi:MAG: prolipoprotein diacylglyceryl transferase [Anaerolineaceae bacterium]|nr:prolipoprotein diacylglyceryl transferase [Anaerolineaceae bacterium]